MESVASVWALGVQSALALSGARRDYLPADFSDVPSALTGESVLARHWFW